MDYYRNFSEPAVQREVFERQIQLAIELKKPLFVHERDAKDDLIRLLGKYKSSDFKPEVLIHCFTGDADTLQEYLNLGGWL